MLLRPLGMATLLLLTGCSASPGTRYFGGYTTLHCTADVPMSLLSPPRPQVASHEIMTVRLIGKVTRPDQTYYRVQHRFIRGLLPASELNNLTCL